MREIETQMIGRHQRSGLLHVLTQHLAQPSMKKVCGGVIAHRCFTTLLVNLGHHRIANSDYCPCNYFVGPDTLNREIAVLHIRTELVRYRIQEPALVPDLATGLCVERRSIEEQFCIL